MTELTKIIELVVAFNKLELENYKATFTLCENWYCVYIQEGTDTIIDFWVDTPNDENAEFITLFLERLIENPIIVIDAVSPVEYTPKRRIYRKDFEKILIDGV